MPSFRSLFLHLLALCIISSTVPNVVASPIALQGGLLEARGVAPSSQAVNAAPDAGPSSNNESSHGPQDDTEELDPEFENVKNVPIRLWRTENEFFQKWVDPKLATFKGEHWWLCVGKQCYRGDPKPQREDLLVVDMKFVSDNQDLQNLQNSFLIGHISFLDLKHKKRVLRSIRKGNLHYRKTNLDFVRSEIAQLRGSNTEPKSDFQVTNKMFEDLVAKMREMKNFG
ncbi:hypothetical protein GG344DRAFT_74309 [Lentinula edodes]|nr:hypothetical protein GG344DRAFT_74309 [Lentinula edodes]